MTEWRSFARARRYLAAWRLGRLVRSLPEIVALRFPRSTTRDPVVGVQVRTRVWSRREGGLWHRRHGGPEPTAGTLHEKSPAGTRRLPHNLAWHGESRPGRNRLANVKMN